MARDRRRSVNPANTPISVQPDSNWNRNNRTIITSDSRRKTDATPHRWASASHFRATASPCKSGLPMGISIRDGIPESSGLSAPPQPTWAANCASATISPCLRNKTVFGAPSGSPNTIRLAGRFVTGVIVRSNRSIKSASLSGLGLSALGFSDIIGHTVRLIGFILLEIAQYGQIVKLK